MTPLRRVTYCAFRSNNLIILVVLALFGNSGQNFGHSFVALLSNQKSQENPRIGCKRPIFALFDSKKICAKEVRNKNQVAGE
jgi:hypothetical protein